MKLALKAMQAGSAWWALRWKPAVGSRTEMRMHQKISDAIKEQCATPATEDGNFGFKDGEFELDQTQADYLVECIDSALKAGRITGETCGLNLELLEKLEAK